MRPTFDPRFTAVVLVVTASSAAFALAVPADHLLPMTVANLAGALILIACLPARRR